MSKGRNIKFFLPVIAGLLLVISGLLVAATSTLADHYDDNECEEYSLRSDDWDDDDDDYDDDDEDCESPDPTPDPCDDNQISNWNFLNIDALATYEEEPCPTPSPSPTPCPEEELTLSRGRYGKPSPTPCPSPTPTPTPTPFTPPVGGGESGNGGSGQAPQCPVDGKPQDIDKVWISDVTATSLTVHWANKGDATGFQIAYGPENNKTQWGVRVNDGKANSFIITDIPQNLKVSVSVTPVNGDCGGNPTEATTALAPTGLVKSISSLLGGFGLITLGLWQAQRAAFSKRVKRSSK